MRPVKCIGAWGVVFFPHDLYSDRSINNQISSWEIITLSAFGLNNFLCLVLSTTLILFKKQTDKWKICYCLEKFEVRGVRLLQMMFIA